MQTFWKDLKTDAGEWLGLALECRSGSSGSRPALRLEAGHNGRIRLVQQDPEQTAPVTRFWATVLNDWYGVHWLRSDAAAAAPVPPSALDSAAIERLAALPSGQRLAAWSRVFADAVAQGPASFLHAGLWVFMGMRPQAARWDFASQKLPRFGASWHIEKPRGNLCTEPVVFIDWFVGRTHEVLCLHDLPGPDDGRVKWWRKKSREGTLPPVLLWYLGCLQCYVIVDGHSRLQAALLEDRPPEFLVAYPACEEAVAANPEAARILDSLQAQINSGAGMRPPQRKPLDAHTLNAVLVAAFDDRPILNERAQGWASRLPETQWLDEVRDRLTALGQPQLLSEFAQR